VNYLKTGILLPVFDNDPNDIKIVHNALKTIDLQITGEADPCISPAGGGLRGWKKQADSLSAGFSDCPVIDVQDCGAAYRFLMALLAATPGKWLLSGTSRLLQRPILPLVNFLNAHGANIQKTTLGWHIEGAALQINDIEINTSETSQYVSALMMIKEEKEKGDGGTTAAEHGRTRRHEGTKARREEGDGRISPSNFEGVPEGRGSLYKNPYIKMTETIMRCMDVARNVHTLSDWSAALFWLANALLKPNAHYLLKNLHFDGLQGDAEVVPHFKQWGLHFTETEHGIEAKHTHNIEIPNQKMDVAQMPDTAMILAVLAVCYPFELTMSGLKNINLKESKRLDILVDELSKFTTVKKHSEDVITIYKRIEELPNVFHFDSYNDHRFVMAWSLFKNFGTVNIKNPDCVKKSYPKFLNI